MCVCVCERERESVCVCGVAWVRRGCHREEVAVDGGGEIECSCEGSDRLGLVGLVAASERVSEQVG